MSKTLNLVDHLLHRGRNQQQMGFSQAAIRTLSRLADFRKLPAIVAEEAQVRLAESLIKIGEYRQARRHLTAALVHEPRHARYHYLLATAWELDDHGDLRKAAEHYRKSLDLDPEQADCLSRYGQLLQRIGRTEEGLDALRHAVEIAPNDVETLDALVAALDQAGCDEEARGHLQRALFLNAGDCRFRRMWDTYRFHETRRRQQADLRYTLADEQEDKPVILKFDPTLKNRLGRHLIRHDQGSGTQPPHQPSRVSSSKHAQ